MTNVDKGSEYFDTDSLRYEIKKKAIRGGGTMLLSRIVGLIIGTLSTVILARLLTPGDFGLVTMVTAFSLLFGNVGLNGFTEAIIQKENITQRQVSTVFWIGIAISIGLAIFFSGCSPLLARFYKEPRLISIAILLSIGFIFNALATEHFALIMRNMQFHKIMVNEIISGVLSAGIAIWMAFNGFGYWALVARQLSSPVVSAVCVWLQCPWRPGLPARDPEVRPIIRFAIKTFGNFFVNYFGRNLDKILLGRKWGSQELGNYDRAYYLFVMPVNQLVAPLSGVALSTLSKLRNDPERYKIYYIKALSLLCLIGMLVSVILTITGRDIILVLLGPQWQKTGQIFSALGPAIGITLIYGTIGWLHLSQGSPGRWLKWNIVAFVFTVLSLIAGLPFGGLGIAIAYSLSFYILTWPGIWYAAKPMGLRLGQVWKAIWRFFAAAMLSGLATWWAINKVHFILRFMEHVHILVRIGLTAVLCTVLYLVSIIILYGSIMVILDMSAVLKMMMLGLKIGRKAIIENAED